MKTTKIFRKIVIGVILAIALGSFVSAATFDLNVALHPLGNINLAGFYMNYKEFIDAIIYMLLFLSLAQMVFLKVYKENKKEAKLIAVALALALTISMVILESTTGFYLGQLGVIALIVFLLVIAILLYNLFLGLFTGDSATNLSAALTYLIIYGLLTVPFSKLNSWIEQNVPLLSGVLSIASIVAFIYLLIKMFKELGGGGGNTPPALGAGNGPALGGNGAGNAPAGGGVQPPAGGGQQPPAGPPPANINPHITNLQNFVRQNLITFARQYAAQGIYIVRVHRGLINNRVETPQDWADFYHMEQTLTQAMGQFNNTVAALINDPQIYPALTPNDLAAFHAIMQEYGAISGKMLIFYNELVAAYNDATRAIPNDPF